jgi:MarR family transcriptional regulator, transcriptional regulator for hemolysin
MADDDDWNPLVHPGHYFSRIARGLARVGDVRLRDLGFAAAQLPVLTALKDGSRMSQTDLARWARVEQPTMAQMLARMERDDIIRREPDPADGRSSLVSLTKQARARLPAGRAVLRQANVEITQGLSGPEVEVLVGLLRRVLANVEAMESASQVAGPQEESSPRKKQDGYRTAVNPSRDSARRKADRSITR